MSSFFNLVGIMAALREIFEGVMRSRLTWALLFMATALLILHMAVTGFSVMDDAPRSADWARIDRDRSLSEAWELVLLLAAAATLIGASTASRRPVFLPLAAILAFLAADNWLQLHERYAEALVPGHQNYGELLFFVLTLCGSAALTLWSWRMATSPERSFLLATWLGILMLGGFGAGVDVVHILVRKWLPDAARAVGVVEDFGELLSISFISAVSWLVWVDLAGRRSVQRLASAAA